MSVNPGWAGQDFLEEALPKIEGVRSEIERQGLRVEVEVDGGINDRRAPAPRGRGDDPGGRVLDLQGAGSCRGGAQTGRDGREVAMAESVLVVDDDPDVARFVEVNLRSAGYEVTVASDGEQGLKRPSRSAPTWSFWTS